MKKIVFIFSFITSNLFAGSINISPNTLEKLNYEKSPAFLRFSAQTQQAKAQTLTIDDQYGWKGQVSAEASETNEQPLIRFQPIFSPVRQVSVGAQKKTAYGLSVTAGIGAISQRFDLQGTRQKRVSSILELRADIDIGQNFLGKQDKNRLDLAHNRFKTSEFNEKIQLARVKNQAQQIYWTLVANKLKKNIVNQLMISANKQLKDIKKQEKSFLAEKSDTATYTYQLSERKGLSVRLDYERTQLEESLVFLLPELKGKKIKIDMPNVPQSVSQALACIDKIAATKNPKDYTLEDEIINLAQENTTKEIKLIKADHYPDIKLHTRVQTLGREGNLGNSISDFTDNNRTGYSVGASVTFALGSEKKTEQARILAYQSSLEAQEFQLDSRLNQVHSNIKKTVQQLLDILDSQKASSKALKSKLKHLRKKYRQARISLLELSIEEDRQLNTEIAIVDTKLAVINSLFEYFNYFTQTPCIFNKAKS